jgi:photosystem II stability/assembly factor-like uncharacterized protein
VQLDGRRANALCSRTCASCLPTPIRRARGAEGRGRARRGRRTEPPFLDVWFANAREGFVVGCLQPDLPTTDGGKTWEPWSSAPQNERYYTCMAFRGSSDGLYMVGELGLALRFDPATGRFNALADAV